MGYYGDFLTFFPEAFINIEFYSMTPQIDGSYIKENAFYKNVIITEDKEMEGLFPHDYSDVLTVFGDTLVFEPNGENALKIAMFFMHPLSNRVTRLIRQLDYVREGSFSVWKARTVTGITDKNDESIPFIHGLI
jgi:hypothetical protein